MPHGFSQFCSIALLSLVMAGCATQPVMLKPAEQITIDRSIVEYPAATELKPLIRGLTAPVGIAFDGNGSILLAESGIDGGTPRVFGFKADGTYFDIWPRKKKLPFDLGIGGDQFKMYPPIGGLAYADGRVYVSHRDSEGYGVITSFDIVTGAHHTVVSDLPAQGDYGVTDLTFNPTNGRLFFAVGSATNSGVVGPDNYEAGWLRDYPKFCDVPWEGADGKTVIKLLGYRFTTPNPRAGLGQEDILVTGPMQPFGVSNHSQIRGQSKPTGAIYSISPTGGDLQVEAHGLHNPRGLRYNEFLRLYATNDGMELRGTRPIKYDPDAMLRIVRGTWYGFPDYSADLQPISEPQFQPPQWMILPTGYPDVSFTIDHDGSGLLSPDRGSLLQATFQTLSGAAKFDFVPSNGPFRDFRGEAVVALWGDRAPFATSGQPMKTPTGYKVMLVDVDGKQVHDFIHNTRDVPAHMLDHHVEALERPIDVKFGPDGALYIVDYGRMDMHDGRERIASGTGKVFKLVPVQDTTGQ